MNRANRRRTAAQNRHRKQALVELPREAAEIQLAEVPGGGVRLTMQLTGSRVLATVELDPETAMMVGERIIEMAAKPTEAELGV